MDNQDPQLRDQGRRGGPAGRTAARGRQGSLEASARALGLLRPRTPRPSEPASERESGARALRAHKAAGRAAAGGRSAGELASRLAFSAAAPQELEQLGRGDAGTRAGRQGTFPAEPRAPTWRSWDTSPRPAGVGAGGVRACLGPSPRAPLSPRRRRGPGGDTPSPRPQVYRACSGSLDCCSEPCLPRPYPRALGAVSGSQACGSRALRFRGGVLKPLSESGGAWGARTIGVLYSLIAAPNL